MVWPHLVVPFGAWNREAAAVSKEPAGNTDLWRKVLLDGLPRERRMRQMMGRIPAAPRCRMCNAPFHGVGGALVKLLVNRRQSPTNPVYCDSCDRFAHKHPGGAEVEITMLFADVRGSTALAEKMSPTEFSRLMNRFYAAAAHAMVHTGAWIDKLVGDEIIGLYIPSFSGPDHAGQALKCAQDLLRATGHADHDGPWLPVGVGVHTGSPFVGTVGSEHVTAITAIGDPMNTTARLVSAAGVGEILVSEAAGRAAHADTSGLEARELQVRGRTDPVHVHVMRVREPA
jgi:adenylate cyclase